jgi:hypothetical protein
MKMYKILNKKNIHNKYTKSRRKFNFTLSVRSRVDGVSGRMVAYLIIIYKKATKHKENQEKAQQIRARGCTERRLRRN